MRSTSSFCRQRRQIGFTISDPTILEVEALAYIEAPAGVGRPTPAQHEVVLLAAIFFEFKTVNIRSIR